VQNLGNEEGEIHQSSLEKFESAINDDLNMPQALSVAWDLIDDSDVSNADKLITIREFDRVLGLKLDEPIVHIIPEKVQKLIAERDKARKEKNWDKSDKLRKEIEKAGFIVNDTPSGTEIKPK